MMSVLAYFRFVLNCIRWRNVSRARWVLAYELEEARRD